MRILRSILATSAASVLLVQAAAAQAPPRVASVNPVGAERTDPDVVVHLTGLVPGQLLTTAARERAERRLRQLPIARSATLRYVLDEDLRAEVQAIIHERSRFPDDPMDWAGIGARLILKEELKLDFAGLTGYGETIDLAWRWERNRPRVIAGVSLPAPGPIRGVLSVDTLFGEEAYGIGPAAAAQGVVRERRRRGGVHLSDWLTPQVRWRAGAAMDRIADRGHVAIDGGLDVRLMEDLIAPGVTMGVWRPTDGSDVFTVTDASVAWRVNREIFPAFSGKLGVTVASAAAPLTVWPSAGTGGSGRGALLRAHPLHEHGVITSENFARRLMYFTFEHLRPLPGMPAGKAAMVAFLDAGRAWAGLPGQPRRVNVDIGTGVRFGSGGGTVRFDVGFGLRDRQWAVSAGWVESWPGR
jgi:hypothetical protein